MIKKFLPTLFVLSLAAVGSQSAFAAANAKFGTFSQTFGEPGKEFSFYTQVSNTGDEAVTEISYTVVIEGEPDRVFTVGIPLGIAVSDSRLVKLKAVAPVELGRKTMRLKMTAVNGQAVDQKLVSGRVNTVDFAPEHRAMVEDYTGTWCQYCPRGFVAMEMMSRDYPGEVLGIAYHNSDPMDVAKFTEPLSIQSFPTLKQNRYSDASPSAAAAGALRDANSLAVAGVTLLRADWTDDTKTSIECEAEVTFGNLVSAGEFQLNFTLIADGLTGTTKSWKQSNAYASLGAGWDDPLWGLFEKSSSVSGLTFNDVCVANTLADSSYDEELPEIAARTPYKVTYTFKDVMSIREYGSTRPIIQHPDKLRVAAVVSNSTDANCDWLKIGEQHAGIGSVSVDSAVFDENAPKEYFNIQGMKISEEALTPGLYIVRQGTKSSKVVIR